MQEYNRFKCVDEKPLFLYQKKNTTNAPPPQPPNNHNETLTTQQIGKKSFQIKYIDI